MQPTETLPILTFVMNVIFNFVRLESFDGHFRLALLLALLPHVIEGAPLDDFAPQTSIPVPPANVAFVVNAQRRIGERNWLDGRCRGLRFFAVGSVRFSARRRCGGTSRSHFLVLVGGRHVVCGRSSLLGLAGVLAIETANC